MPERLDGITNQAELPQSEQVIKTLGPDLTRAAVEALPSDYETNRLNDLFTEMPREQFKAVLAELVEAKSGQKTDSSVIEAVKKLQSLE